MQDRQLYLKLRVFVASPGDVAKERDIVSEVANKLNRPDGAATKAGIVLDVVRWETHVSPYMGIPQQVVLDQLPVDSWDIFIGILWRRFGLPTGLKKKSSGEDYFSGTEQEFDLAYQSWEKKRRPQISFYRRIDIGENATLPGINTDQLKKVNAFFEGFKSGRSTQGLYRSYSGLDEFRTLIERNLTILLNMLTDQIENQRINLCRGMMERKGYLVQPTSDSTSKHHPLKPGEVYDVAFLSLDLAGHSNIVRKYKHNPALPQRMIKNFHDFSVRIANIYDGEIFAWRGDGGIFIFAGERYRERCLLTGIMLLNECEAFNLDREKNPLSAPAALRIAANYALVRYPENKETFSSDALNLAVKIQEQYAGTGEFCVTTSILDGLDKRLGDVFKFKGRFALESIYAHGDVKKTADISEEKLAYLFECSKKHEAKLKCLFDKKQELSSKDLDQISASFDFICSSLESFCTLFDTVDKKWSMDFLEFSLKIAEGFLKQEQDVWDIINQRFRALPRKSTSFEKFTTMANVCASRRAKPVVFLGRIIAELDGELRGEKKDDTKPVGIKESFEEKLEKLVNAEDLDEEIFLFDMLLNYEVELLNFIQKGKDIETQRIVLNKLWELADLLLQHHLYFHSNIQWHRGKKILSALFEEPVKDERFAALNELLSQIEIEFEESVLRKVDYFTRPHPVKLFVQVVWKCLCIGHPSRKTRKFASSRLDVDFVLQIVARNRVPLDLIYNLGLRFNNAGSDDNRKIFFDCTRAKIAQAILEAKSKESVIKISGILKMFLQYEFLVETLYFERYDEIYSNFLERVAKMGFKIGYLEKYKKELEELRKSKGSPSGTLPEISKIKLPPPIKRRLAGEAPYIDLFVSDPDFRIAKETIRHIKQDNIAQVLNNPDVNEMLLQKLLKKSEFFSKGEIKKLALLHPKCTIEFGRNKIMSYGDNPLGKSALREIALKAGNYEIKRLAKMRLGTFGPK